jgi:hypothetical protein
MSDDLLQRARQWADTFGPSNGWTGTSGTAATIIHHLLEVIEAKQAEVDGLTVRLSGQRLEGTVEEVMIYGHEIRSSDVCGVRCCKADIHGQSQPGAVQEEPARIPVDEQRDDPGQGQ